MNIKQITKKDGTIVYRANIYLGVDSLTGKQVRTTATAKTRKQCEIKANQAINKFNKNGCTVAREKVVFNIRILPVVKVFSAVFVHAFFIIIVLLIYTFMGYPPSLYAIQLLYYSFCIFMLILAVTYLTSAAVVFFRDLSQIINIGLQVGVWVTPIMWDFNDLGLSGILTKILKLNPLFYIVQGYRDSLINKVAIWQHPVLTLYFWVFTIAVFFLGTRLFKKLQVHFADVL